MQYEISGSVLAGQITTTTWSGAPSRTWAWSRAIGGAGRGIGGAGQFASWTRADFDNTISKLDESGLLFQVLERFGNVDLHPDTIDNATMATVFEELIRRFNEALNENPGEHFTPRDVVHLMVDLMLAGDEGSISGEGAVRTVYDPCCGSGGMLTIAKEHIAIGHRENGNLLTGPVNPLAEIHLYGQEVNPETWAVSKSDLYMKDSNADVTVVLPVTTKCGAQGSICTQDGRKLSNSLNFTVTGPNQ